MDAATLSAISALGGATIGGLTSGLTTMLNQRSRARAEKIAHGLARRQDLVRDFIVEASKTYGEALVNDEPKMQDLVNLYAMVSRMRALAMPRTVACAEQLMREIVETYLGPNRTIRDLHAVIKSGSGIDPLREFSEAARDELEAAWASL